MVVVIVFLSRYKKPKSGDGWLACNLCSNNAHYSLIWDCRQLMGKIPEVKIRHCFREANQCADKLAKKGAFESQDVVIYVDPPSDIYMLMYFDSIGLYYERLCLKLVAFQSQDFVIYVDPPSDINMLMYYDSIGL